MRDLLKIIVFSWFIALAVLLKREGLDYSGWVILAIITWIHFLWPPRWERKK